MDFLLPIYTKLPFPVKVPKNYQSPSEKRISAPIASKIKGIQQVRTIYG
jgi:hypothetical protein